MNATVDVDAIRRRQHVRIRQGRQGVDLWVVLPGLDRITATDVVHRGLRECGDVFWRPLPTSEGVYVWLAWMNDGPRAPERLARWLDGQGHTDAHVTAAPVDPHPRTLAERRFPSAVLRYTPASQPVPAALWGVDARVTTGLVQESAHWIAETGGPLRVGRTSMVPLTATDAAEITGYELGRNPLRLLMAAWVPDESEMRRVVRFDSGGRVARTDLDPDASLTDLVAAAREHLVESALQVDHGAVRNAVAGADEFNDGPGGHWRRPREEWLGRVPDVHGIQLLRTEHLDRARDLSAWDVRAVAADRFLVEARDLEPWFAPDGVPYEVLTRARADFGDLITSSPRPAFRRGPVTDGRFIGDLCHASLHCAGEEEAHWVSPDEEDETYVEEAFVASTRRDLADPPARPGAVRGRVEVAWNELRQATNPRGTQVTLRVAVETLGRREAAVALAQGLETAGGRGAAPARQSRVHPTVGGTWVGLRGVRWDDRLAVAAQEWEAAGLRARVVPCELPVAEGPVRVSPAVAATCLVLRPSAPFEDGPRRPHGRHLVGRWGVGDALTTRVAQVAARWTGPGTLEGDDMFHVPYTIEDVEDLLRPCLEERPRADLDGGTRRVTFSEFGAVAWGEERPDLDVDAQVEAAVARLVDAADDVLHGSVNLAQLAALGHGTLDASTRRWAPHLMATHVASAQGIQLLSGAHLAHAHDLSAWTVEEVRPDRFLVRAKDLAPWFDSLRAEVPNTHVDVAVTEQARADFGDMVLTRAVALATVPDRTP